MKRGFYIIMAAQFFSSLADNALLDRRHRAAASSCTAPAWMTPLLKFFFTVSYVRARRVRRRVRRLDAEGPGDVHHQHGQDRRLPDDVLPRLPDAAGRRRHTSPSCSPTRSSASARRPTRPPSTASSPSSCRTQQAGGRQRLDRRAHRRARSSSARCSAARWSASTVSAQLLGIDMPAHRHRHRHAAPRPRSR